MENTPAGFGVAGSRNGRSVPEPLMVALCEPERPVCLSEPRCKPAVAGLAATATDETALLKAFAGIQPIDAHLHVYKDGSAFNTLMQLPNLRARNICGSDDRDPFLQRARNTTQRSP
jgi:hypothetical protein